MTLRAITYDRTVYTCPFSTTFRRHTDDEAAHLRESVASDGVLVPIRLYRDTLLGLDGCVLDGEGRLTAALEVGAPPDRVPFDFVGELPTEEAYRRAKVLNDVRRHDDPQAIRKRRAERIERVALARTLGASLRAIAEAEELSEKTVRNDLEASTAEGYAVDPPDLITGRDGKKRPAKRRPKANPPSAPDVPAHPFAALMSASTTLTANLTRAINAGDEYGQKLKHVLTVCGLLDYPAELGGNPRFLPLSGVHALLNLAGLLGKLPPDATVKLTYAKANGTWSPPLNQLRREAKRRR